MTGIVDSNMNVVVEYSYDAWGKLIETTGSEVNFTGKLNPFLYCGIAFQLEVFMLKKFMAIFFALVCICSFASCEETTEYPIDGRDTHDYFGNARFVVLLGWDYLNNKKYYDLYDQSSYNSIDVITNYKDIKPNVYAIGEKGYTKLNYETGEFTQSLSLSDFSNEDQIIFEKLQKNNN